jgi:putative ABC transport system permease protein
MNISGSWRIARRNLARNQRRNLATGAAIALGFAALVALTGYVYRVDNYLRTYSVYATRVGHLAIYKQDGLEKFSLKPKVYSLTGDEVAKIAAVVKDHPNVDLHGGQLLGAGLIGNGCKTLPFIATGIDPQLDAKLRRHPEIMEWAPRLSHYLAGRGISEYPADLGAIAISQGLARLLAKPKVHDQFPPNAPINIVDCMAPDAKEKVGEDANVQLVAGSWTGMMAALDGEIVASYTTGVTDTNNTAIVTGLDHLQRLYDTQNVTVYTVWLKQILLTRQSMNDLKAQLKEAGLEVDVYAWNQDNINPFYVGTMQFLYTMVGFITFILATVIVFSIFNSATITVIERSQEIGMMRSLGYTRGQVRRLFVAELLMLALISLAIGAFLAIVGIEILNRSNIQFRPPGVAGGMTLQLIPNALGIVGGLVLILVLAIGAVLLAVRQVSARNIAVLLGGSHR